jgi:hypothetical protein
LTTSAANAPSPVTTPSPIALSPDPAADSIILGRMFWIGAMSATFVPKFASISAATNGRFSRGAACAAVGAACSRAGTCSSVT